MDVKSIIKRINLVRGRGEGQGEGGRINQRRGGIHKMQTLKNNSQPTKTHNATRKPATPTQQDPPRGGGGAGGAGGGGGGGVKMRGGEGQGEGGRRGSR